MNLLRKLNCSFWLSSLYYFVPEGVSAESLDVEKTKESYMKDEPAEHNKHFGIRFASRKTKKKKQLPENYDTCRRLYCAFRLFVLVPIFLIDSIGFGM